MLKPIDTGVFFIFMDETNSSHFVNVTKSGILVKGGPQADVPRWGAVVRVADNVAEVQVGDCILVEKGMWTSSFTTDGIKLWKTDESKIICVSDEPYAVI